MVRFFLRRFRGTVLAKVALSLVAILAILATVTAPTFAAGGQYGALSGTIVNAANRAPVSGARVTAASPSGTFRAVTGANGQFSLNGLPIDTYTVSIQAQGYDMFSQAGVTVIGDQTNQVGNIGISKTLRTIARVTTRSIASAFQPTQTTDSVTISGARITQTAGKEAATDERNLILAAPGTSLASNGAVTIRGGLQTEVGYQLDGVPFTEPFFNGNGSSGFYNGVGSVQVVEGAGDATQGNVGGGVVNTITKRGTYPGFGLLDAEVGAPNYFHQFHLEYGTATRSGNISNYFSYTGQRDVPYSDATGVGNFGYGYSGTNVATLGNGGFYGFSNLINNSLRDNFIVKFGHDNSQSLQVLYDNEDLQQFGDRGGLFSGTSNPLAFYPYDPSVQNNYGVGVGLAATPNFQNLVPGEPGLPYGVSTPSSPEQIGDNRTNLLKFEYDSNLGQNTFLALRVYNEFLQQIASGNAGVAGQGSPFWQDVGGQRVGGQVDLTRSFGSRLTVTLHGEDEVQKPQWDGYQPYMLFGQSLGATSSLVGQCDTVGATSYAACTVPDYKDFLPGGYIYNYFGGNVPRIPTDGINYHNGSFLTSAEAIRVQFNPTDKLRFDLGYRRDAEIYKYGTNPFAPASLKYTNPSDVDPATIGPEVLRPQVDEPRAAVSYEIDRNDSVRFSYGRSAQFANAQTGGTPFGIYNDGPYRKVPPKPGSMCGSGVANSITFPCQNYASQLFWFGDQNNDAPDIGATLPTIFSNYDFTYQHQFGNGFGMRVTPFIRNATGVPSFSFVSEQISPTTGQFLGGVFTTNNLGVNKTTGLEFGLTSPDKPVGLSGFFTATYQNVLDSTPPLLSGENNLPAIQSSSLLLHNVYRAGYVSPLQARLGVTYRSPFGLHITPVLNYDRGYPYTIGNLTPSILPVGGVNANIPQVNFPGGSGRTQIPGFNGTQGIPAATNFADPALPGTSFNPNIAATRGTPATSAPGGVLSKPNFDGDLTVEYQFRRNTIGVQILNVGANPYYESIPLVNPYYQAVATGVSGPQTNQVPSAVDPTLGAARGYANVPSQYNAFTNGAYLVPFNQPLHIDAYYQLSL